MTSFRFSVTPEAARYFDRIVQMLAKDSPGIYVVTISPHTEPNMVDLVDGSLAKTVDDMLKKVHADPRIVDPSTMKFQWGVGIGLGTRFPPEDIIVCNGVPCFIPREIMSVLDGRSLALVDNELRIDPTPPSPTAP